MRTSKVLHKRNYNQNLYNTNNHKNEASASSFTFLLNLLCNYNFHMIFAVSLNKFLLFLSDINFISDSTMNWKLLLIALLVAGISARPADETTTSQTDVPAKSEEISSTIKVKPVSTTARLSSTTTTPSSRSESSESSTVASSSESSESTSTSSEALTSVSSEDSSPTRRTNDRYLLGNSRHKLANSYRSRYLVSSNNKYNRGLIKNNKLINSNLKLTMHALENNSKLTFTPTLSSITASLERPADDDYVLETVMSFEDQVSSEAPSDLTTPRRYGGFNPSYSTTPNFPANKWSSYNVGQPIIDNKPHNVNNKPVIHKIISKWSDNPNVVFGYGDATKHPQHQSQAHINDLTNQLMITAFTPTHTYFDDLPSIYGQQLLHSQANTYPSLVTRAPPVSNKVSILTQRPNGYNGYQPTPTRFHSLVTVSGLDPVKRVKNVNKYSDEDDTKVTKIKVKNDCKSTHKKHKKDGCKEEEKDGHEDDKGEHVDDKIDQEQQQEEHEEVNFSEEDKDGIIVVEDNNQRPLKPEAQELSDPIGTGLELRPLNLPGIIGTLNQLGSSGGNQGIRRPFSGSGLSDKNDGFLSNLGGGGGQTKKKKRKKGHHDSGVEDGGEIATQDMGTMIATVVIIMAIFNPMNFGVWGLIFAPVAATMFGGICLVLYYILKSPNPSPSHGSGWSYMNPPIVIREKHSPIPIQITHLHKYKKPPVHVYSKPETFYEEPMKLPDISYGKPTYEPGYSKGPNIDTSYGKGPIYEPLQESPTHYHEHHYEHWPSMIAKSSAQAPTTRFPNHKYFDEFQNPGPIPPTFKKPKKKDYKFKLL